MAGIATSSAGAAATKCAEILVDKVVKEIPYLFCYKSYASEFEAKREDLKAAVESVDMKIKEAQKRNETQIDPIVKHWVEKANRLIQQETSPDKWSSRYSKAKELEMRTLEIPTMMEKAENFSQVAHAAERPGMEFYSLEFMRFKSRDSNLERLRKELQDGSKCRIGLQAMGGSGKTTMAKAIGKELENSTAFDKVIFIEVPNNPVDEKKIQDEIEKKLDLKLDDEEKKNLSQAEQIWIRIANSGNVLIILDDVWEEINLEAIGIHRGSHGNGRCCVLLTTRYDRVCSSMRCQGTIKLEELSEEEAVDLFLHHASKSGKDCPHKLKFLATKIVNKCGKLPVVVIAVAKTFRNWEPDDWEDAFAATENYSSFGHGNSDDKTNKFYDSLKMSFKHLDPRAQDLILLCSTFPRTYEIPVELLVRIAIGSGLCGNDVDSYYKARSEVLLNKITLTSSALLMTAPKGCVRMHDVIREVAQNIADGKIEEIKNSETKLKESTKYSSWSLNDFSNRLEGKNLEVLLGWVNADGFLEVSETFFVGMKQLRVLLLCSTTMRTWRTIVPSLPKSIRSLENIQTLSLTNWDLDDISIFQNLKNLQSLDLTNCSILEVPNGFSQLEKLRLLSLVSCSIKRNNPFEVIGRCLKLEVLYYVSNDDFLNSNAKPSKIIDLGKFRIYHVECGPSKHSFQLDASTRRYFNSTKLKGVLSKSTVKSLAARAEILVLTECEEKNLLPDIVHPIEDEDEGMDELIRLSLISWPASQCLVNTNEIRSNATIFSNLVELRLHDMRVRELCHGDFPKDFLKKLEKLDLSNCVELEGTLFKGKLELSNLKSVVLRNCSMSCLFHSSTAQNLKELENLYIRECSKLRCLIRDDERPAEQKLHNHQDPNQNVHHFDLPALTDLFLHDVPNMVSICPKNYYVKALSLQNIRLGTCSHLPMNTVMDFFADVQKIEEDLAKRKEKGFACLHIVSKASKAKSVASTAHGYFPPPSPYQFILRKIEIHGLSQLKSLFTTSIASSLKFLETLKIWDCDTLQHIITVKGPNMNVHPILPNLREVRVTRCNKVEYVFPAFYSKDLKHLKFIDIAEAEKLRYLFGKCHVDDQKHSNNIQSKLSLPALDKIFLKNVPNMVSICTGNYFVEDLKCVSLQRRIPLIDSFIGEHRRQEDITKRTKALSLSLQEFPNSMDCKNFSSFRNLSSLSFVSCDQLNFIMSASTTRSIPELRHLRIYGCHELVSIIRNDEQNHQSYFPELRKIEVEDCRKMKCLFYISTCPKLPRLLILDIRDAPELEQVFEGKKQELVINDVLPNLHGIRLVNLPSLHSSYQGIDFQNVKIRFVLGCGSSCSLVHNFSNSFDQDLKKLIDADDDNDIEIIDQWFCKLSRAPIQEKIRVAFMVQKAALQHLDDAGQSNSLSINKNKRDSTIQKQKRSSPNLTEIEEEGSQQDIGKDSPNFDKAASTSSYDSNNNTETSSNEIVEEQLPPSSSKPDGDLCGKESMVDEQAQRESGSSNNEAPQRVEEPTHQSSSKETSNEVSLKIPPPHISEMTSALTTQMATSTTHKEMGSGSSQSNLSTISAITDQSVQDTETSKDEIVQEQLPTSYTTTITSKSSRELCEKESKGDEEELGESTSLHEGFTMDLFTKEATKKVGLEILPKSDRHLKTKLGEGSSLENYDQASSSTYPRQKIEEPYTLTPSKELCGKESMVARQAPGETGGSNNKEPAHECSSNQKSNETPLITSISSPKMPQIETFSTQGEKKPGSFAITDQTAQGQILVNQRETPIHVQQIVEDDLIRLFLIMRDGSDLEAGQPYVPSIADFEDEKVAKAFADIESSFKMDLNHIALSEEYSHRLENALDFLSSSFSQEEPSSHGLVRAKIENLHQEIKRILSSFKQASDTFDTLTKLEEKEKWIDEQHSQRMEAATTLVSEIRNTEEYVVGLKGQISRLKAELKRKEKELEDSEMKLSSFHKQKKECVLETIGFMEEYEAVKKDHSYVRDGQTKASQELRELENQWPSCVANLKKTALMLGILLKNKS